jgi:hypothetical protein
MLHIFKKCIITNYFKILFLDERVLLPLWKIKYSHGFGLCSEGVTTYHNHKKRLKKHSFIYIYPLFFFMK